MEQRKFPFKRVFRIKNALLYFLCPLCGTQRGLRYTPHLTAKHYTHILMISLFLGLVSWPLIREKVIYLGLFVWAIYELVLKLLYRQDLPCPHCGFDATWYNRDVKMARSIVQSFWAKK